MPDDVMRVELTTPGLDRSVAQIERLAAAYDRLGDAEARIGNLTGGTGGGGGAGAGPVNARGGGRGPAATGFLTGPRQQMQQVEAQIRRAEAEKNDAARGDLLDRKMRLERSIYLNEMRRKRGRGAIEGPGLLELFGDMNSLLGGLGGGGGAGRLLGQGIELFQGGLNITQKLGGLGGAAGGAAGAGGAAAGVAGLGAVAGPAAAALALAAAKAAAFAAVVQQSTQSLAAFGAATGMSGGTSAGVGALMGGGVPVGEIAARGARIRAARSSDPFAIQLLGYASPFQFSADQDDAAQLQKAMTLLRSLRGRPGEQLRAARVLGQEDLLGRVNVSPFVERMQDRTGALAGRVNDAASLQAARDLTEQQRLMIEQWNLLQTELGKPGVKLFSEVLRDLDVGVTVGHKALRGLGSQLDATFGKANLDKVQGVLGSMVAGSVLGPAGGLFGLIKGLLGLAGGDQPEDVQKKQLTELEKLNRQIDQGIHGGGPNAQSALPVHLRGLYLDQAAMGRVRRYGGIGI